MMQLYKWAIALSLTIYSHISLADVVVIAPEEIVVVAIDQQQIGGSLFRGKENEYRVNAGAHQISVRYEDIFYHKNGEHDVIKSNIVTLTTPELTEDQTYRLELLPQPKEFAAAKKFAATPVIGLKNNRGQVLVSQTGADSRSTPWFENGLFSRVFDLTDQTPTTANKITPITTSLAEKQQQPSDLKVQQMIELWQSATPAQRQQFAAWLASIAAK